MTNKLEHEMKTLAEKIEVMTDIGWVCLENIVLVIASCLCAYFISPWCFLLLVNLSTIKRSMK